MIAPEHLQLPRDRLPTVAVVIPCFNHGSFLQCAIESAERQSYGEIEIVVVDDGSTDPVTIRALDSVCSRPSARPIQVLRRSRGGPSAARNTAIAATTATYILPLDADDLIDPQLVAKSVAIMERNPRVGIVSCLAAYFGLHQGNWFLQDYQFPGILLKPSLFVTGLYRRSDWVRAGGYKEDMVHGYEDHDFWLSLIEMGLEVYRIPEVLFHYRRCTESVSTRIDLEKKVQSYTLLFQHHKRLYSENIAFVFRRLLEQELVLDDRLGPAMLQVFAPGPNGFEEARSVRSNYAQDVVVELELQTPELSTPLGTDWRIDPGIAVGVFEIHRICISTETERPAFDAGGSQLRQIARAAGTAIFLPSDGNLKIFSFGTDPQVIISPVPLSDGGALRVRIWLHACSRLDQAADGFAALRQLVVSGKK